MNKFYSLPGVMILGLEAIRTNLEQALQRADLPTDHKENLKKLCEALTSYIQLSAEAQLESVSRLEDGLN
jgi:hypothetical protein